MQSYKIGASSLSATYNAGTYVAASAREAIEKARDEYRRSALGRALGDVGAFRFYVCADRAEECDGDE